MFEGQVHGRLQCDYRQNDAGTYRFYPLGYDFARDAIIAAHINGRFWWLPVLRYWAQSIGQRLLATAYVWGLADWALEEQTWGNRVCVCNRKYHAWRLPPGDAAFNELYASYRGKAARRGFTFDLSKEQFRFLTTMSCTYCGKLPSQVNYTKADRGGTGYTYSGVDRIDSAKGYTWDNCKSCCKRCNMAKNDMPLAEWIAHIKQIYIHMGLGVK